MAMVRIDLLIGKIASVLENEASLIVGVSDELGEIKHELVSMRSFLEDCEKKRVNLTEGEKAWVANVRYIANQVEDIIDEFMYRMNRQHEGGMFRRLLNRVISLPKNLLVKHQIATKLQNINKEIKSTSERRLRYGIDRIEGRSSLDDDRWVRSRGESSLFVKDDDLVGIEDDRQLLVGWLTNGEPQRTVISVVGMGGSGKTTLVAKAYNCQVVKRHFDCYAWITVSQTYVIEDLIKSMIKEFYFALKEEIPMDLNIMSSRQLNEMLVNFLRPKKYVIILDDVWSMKLWSDIDASLPNERLGSRVMLTTRNENIASSSFGVKSLIHYLKPLELTEAWALFCTKAFSSNPNRSCPPELEILAHDLVAKCRGLPLAIVALAGVLSSKKLEYQWRSVYNSLTWELSNDPMLETVKTILLLSFNDLPYQLKRCFLYCCLFPEDYLIKRNRLIRLWMAEGFIEKVKGLQPEELAESYLVEISCRNMLQVERRDYSGRPEACKMHDLMREVALSTSAIEKFCALYDMQEEATVENGARRLSIHTSDRKLKPWKGMSQLRSLLVFSVDKISLSMKTLPSGFRLLKVLDLEGVPIVKLPEDLAEFFNLRYLNLRRTKVKVLPKSIGRLLNLQTLDIGHTGIEVLPAGISKLQNIRHLIAYRTNKRFEHSFDFVYGIQVPSNIHKLENLQILDSIEADSNLLKQLRNMTQLKRLGLRKVREADENDLCISIQNMKLLHNFRVHTIDEEEYLQLNALSSPPPNLNVLSLAGKLEKMPHWVDSLNNLTSLYLHWSRMIEDPIPYIEQLPNLGELKLVNAYVGNQLNFCTGFQKLRDLYLGNFPQVKEITIHKGVMPGARKLYLGRCMALKMLPHGIEYLTDLQELNLLIIPNELTNSMRGNKSVDRHKVQHIPKINHYYQLPSGIFHESLS